APMGTVLSLRRALANHFRLSAIGLIAPHSGFYAVQQIGQHRRVSDVGRRRHRRVDDLGLAIYPHLRLHSEVPLLALLRLVHLRIALLLPILGRSGCVQDGRVASTIVPVVIRTPCACRGRFTCPRICSPSWCSSSKCRNLHTVVSSGTGSQPRSMPTNCRITAESYSASSTPGSDRLNHCCKK